MFRRYIALVIGLAAPAAMQSSETATLQNQSRTPPPLVGNMTSCAAQPDTPQEMFVPLAHLRLFDSGELVLNNNGADPMAVQLTWYVRGTDPVAGPPLTIAPQTMVINEIESLLPARVDRSRVEGMHVAYRGKLLELGGQVVLHRSGNRADSIDVHFSMGMDFRSARREAAWAANREELTTVVIANTGSYPTEVRVTSPDGARTVSIEGNHSQLVRLANRPPHFDWPRTPGAGGTADRESRAMWAVVESNGDPADLRVTGFVMPDRGPSRLIRFYDPEAVKQPHLFATGMRVRRAAGEMTLKNTSVVRLVARPEFLDSDSGEPVLALDPIRLEPNSARTIDLRSAMATLSRTVAADAVSVRVLKLFDNVPSRTR